METIHEVENFQCDHPKETWFSILGSIRVCWVCHNYCKLELLDLAEQREREKQLGKNY